MKVYNAEGMILGRLAAKVAKDALLGEEVVVLNCEKAIISGKKALTLKAQKQKYDRRGYPTKSSKIIRLPDRMVRRSIRGMLPWDAPRGREAFKRVMCYIGTPEEFANSKIIVLEEAAAAKLPTLKQVTMGEVCAYLGWSQKE